MTKYGNPWILAARPKTLPAGAGPVLIGIALSYRWESFDLLAAVLTLICALLLQVSSNLINDYYDGVSGLDNEERLGPPRAVSLGLIPANRVKKGFQLTLGLSLILGTYLMFQGGWPIIIIGLSSLFFAWAYTGGPFPLSYFGLGELAAFLFFGPIAVYGTWFLQTKQLVPPNNVIFMGCGVGLISSALMGVNNLRDISGDKSQGKTTIATILGAQGMRKLIVLFLISSQLMGLITVSFYSPLACLIGIIPMALFYRTWWQILGSTHRKDLNTTLANVGKYLFSYSLTYSAIIYFAH